MNFRSLRLLLLGVFALALLGGGAAGMLGARYSLRTSRDLIHTHLPLSEELHLDAAQQEQIRAIWENVRQNARADYDAAQRLDKKREDDLLALLNEQQKAQYQAIYQQYQDQSTALFAKRDKMLHQAIEQTRSLLNDQQRARYDQLLADRLKDRHDAGGFGDKGNIVPPAATSAARR